MNLPQQKDPLLGHVIKGAGKGTVTSLDAFKGSEK
jgi:hypothetical protein